MKVQVSIVVPVFNKVRYIEQCIESAIGQKGVEVEVICVDDASTDGSFELLDFLSRSNPRLQVLRNDRNRGPGVARNRGISGASGEFIRMLDADDLLPTQSSAALYETAMRHGSDLVRGSLAIFRDPNSEQVQSVVAMANKHQTRFSEESSLWIPWWHTSYLISTTLIRQNRLSYPDLRRGEDPVFMAGVLLKSRSISLIDQIVYQYRKYPKSTGSGGATFEDVMATLRHAAVVKELYCARNPDYWLKGYGPFLRDDVQRLLNKSRLEPVQQRLAESEVQSIWSVSDSDQRSAV